jgi:DedD protein
MLSETTIQRIVGALVIVALAVIIIPLLHSRSRQQSVASVVVPVEPSLPKVALKQPDRIPDLKVAARVPAAPAKQLLPTQKVVAQMKSDAAELAKRESEAREQALRAQAKAIAARKVLSDKLATKKRQARELAEAKTPVPVKVASKAPVHRVAAKPRVVAKPRVAPAPRVAMKKRPDVSKPHHARTRQPVVTQEVWLVQLGSFSERGNAVRLKNKLRRRGYRAFVRTMDNGRGRELTRLLVGPEIKRSMAERLQRRLRRVVHINGIVIPYQVTHQKA